MPTPTSIGLICALDMPLPTSDFYTLIPGAHFSLNARASGFDVLKFFGIGNETAFNHQLADEGFYKVRQQQYSINPELGFPLFPNAEMHV